MKTCSVEPISMFIINPKVFGLTFFLFVCIVDFEGVSISIIYFYSYILFIQIGLL